VIRGGKVFEEIKVKVTALAKQEQQFVQQLKNIGIELKPLGRIYWRY
jgi:hypothetical protein